MTETAWAVTLFAIAVSGVVCWRAGGKPGFARAATQLRADLEALRPRPRQLSRLVLELVHGPPTRQRIARAKGRLAGAADGATARIDPHIERAYRELDALERALEDGSAFAEPENEASVATCARQLEARAEFILGQTSLWSARRFAEGRELGVAEAEVERAASSLETAREVLLEALPNREVATAATSLVNAASAIPLEDEQVLARIDSVIAEGESLLAVLENAVGPPFGVPSRTGDEEEPRNVIRMAQTPSGVSLTRGPHRARFP